MFTARYGLGLYIHFRLTVLFVGLNNDTKYINTPGAVQIRR